VCPYHSHVFADFSPLEIWRPSATEQRFFQRPFFGTSDAVRFGGGNKNEEISKINKAMCFCVLCGTILIVSAIAGTVLLNCTTRYNVASNQVQSWKAALQAAEAGGDIAYAELRKTILDPSNAFSIANGWTSSGLVHTSPVATLGSAILKSKQRG